MATPEEIEMVIAGRVELAKLALDRIVELSDMLDHPLTPAEFETLDKAMRKLSRFVK